MTRIVLADVTGQQPHGSGGAPLPYDRAIQWLTDEYGAEVVTLMLDFGQGRELEALRDRALGAGAVRAHVLDVASEFAAHFVLPALKAGALSPDGRPSVPGLERMVTAQKLVEVAAIEQTTVVAHAYADSVGRFTTALSTLDARLTVVALPHAAVGSDHATGDLFAVSAAGRRSEPAFVDLTFVHGVPTAINGVAMPLTDLVSSINMLAGTHARYPNHRQTASARLLHDAHRGLQESLAADQTERRAVGRQYAELIDTGAWFSPARQTLDAAVERLETPVSGTVRLQLDGDDCHIVNITPLETGKMITLTRTQG